MSSLDATVENLIEAVERLHTVIRRRPVVREAPIPPPDDVNEQVADRLDAMIGRLQTVLER